MGADLKAAVRRHWDEEPCGTRYGDADQSRVEYFTQLERERYRLEPEIYAFAEFAASAGQRVLEVGTGPGNDFVQWPRAGALAVGVDLTRAGTRLTAERLRLEGHPVRLAQADAEILPFRDNAFDRVYSYGVLHHTPDTPRAIREVYRVLKPGGVARVMIYHHPSLTGLFIWLRHCALTPWRSMRWAVEHHLESPGTKTYTRREAASLFTDFSTVRAWTGLGVGDLLTLKLSGRRESTLARLALRLYPRWLVKRLPFIGSLGLVLYIDATK